MKGSGQRRLPPLGQRPPTAVRVSSADLVELGHLPGAEGFPLLVRPCRVGLDAADWARGHRHDIRVWLRQYGAVLLRGFAVDGAEAFEALAHAIIPELLDYNERAAPRTQVTGKVYTSTEFAADQVIPLHHEMSYSHNWPMHVLFFCSVPPAHGGATPIASERRVTPRIDPSIWERFTDHGVMYVRNFSRGLDLPWQEAFQTEDRRDVERYCEASGIEYDWRDDDCLRTRQVRQAVATHPETGETVWFNHAHLFHVSNMDADTRGSLIAQVGMEGLPRNAYYGDGSPIDDATMARIRQLYDEAAVSFVWERGDVMILDNFLTTHGRAPYRGPRQILVAMAELYANRELARPAGRGE